MTDKLSDEKEREIRDIFNYFDKNGDKTITIDELADVLRVLGGNPTTEEVQSFLEQYDTNNSGKIEFNEFVKIYNDHLRNSQSEEDLVNAFKVFDRDGNGVITTSELKEVMTNLGDKLSDEEAEAMIRDADADGDGVVDYKEFIKFMMRQQDY